VICFLLLFSSDIIGSFWSAITGQAPKALIGALVPLVQFLWKYYTERRFENRKTALRSRIVELSKQMEALVQIQNLLNFTQIRDDMQSDLEASMAELALIPAKAARHNKRIRWFFLYTPKSFRGWIFHSLFFVTLGYLVVGTAHMVVRRRQFDFSDPLGLSLAYLMFLLIALVFWGLARYFDYMAKRKLATGIE
jgi:hypothetical protein